MKIGTTSIIEYDKMAVILVLNQTLIRHHTRIFKDDMKQIR